MYKTKINFFNPYKIALSGQAFRIAPIDGTHTELVSRGKYLQIADLGESVFAFSCGEEEFNNIWHNYFDLGRDYEGIARSVDPGDDFLVKATGFGSGIRILKQECFETVISYIISQRRSIPSITTCVDRLSSLCGGEVPVPDEVFKNDIFVSPLKEKYYAFPDASRVAELTADDLNRIGAGYRTPYIMRAAQDFNSGKLTYEGLDSLDDDELYKALTSMYGVGVKVANCIMLFSFARTGRFPVDVWIKRIEDKYYGGKFDETRYPGTAGILQQFMFYYIRKGSLEE